jgi:hypothetical protein
LWRAGKLDSLEMGQLFADWCAWLRLTGVPRSALRRPIVFSSLNRYASRYELYFRYATDPFLATGQPWYHAELFDSVRLRALM